MLLPAGHPRRKQAAILSQGPIQSKKFDTDLT
jgi:hypothetical protein